jgi:hypothetical protein
MKEVVEGAGALTEVIFLKTMDWPGLSCFFRRVEGLAVAWTVLGFIFRLDHTI